MLVVSIPCIDSWIHHAARTCRTETELGLVEKEMLDEPESMLVTLAAATEVLIAIVERGILRHELPEELLQTTERRRENHPI